VGFSFERVDAADYEALRPGYAQDAAAWVADRAGLRRGELVVDVAAGTGQLSRRFVALGVDVVAVEPASNMRAELARVVDGVRAIGGLAEALAFRDRAAGAIVVGNAFHHMDPARAFAEARRVLRAGGAFALFWARSAEGVAVHPVLERIDREIERRRVPSPTVDAYLRAKREPPQPIGGFAPIERRSFPMPHVIASARLADLYATSSDIAAMPDAAREALLDRVRELAHELPETVEVPAGTDVDLWLRV
jgi:SAM-dependent methyltransferase